MTDNLDSQKIYSQDIAPLLLGKLLINYYLINGSPMYACALGMQKALDHENLTNELAKLMYTGLPMHDLFFYCIHAKINLYFEWLFNFLVYYFK